MKETTIAAIVVFGALISSNAKAADVCEILARNLHQDVLTQGTLSEQFLQLRQLVSDNQYSEWSNASASSHTFNGSLSIPDEVDAAIGDGQTSSQSNWHERRVRFLGMNFQDTNSIYRASSHISLTNVAALQTISNCASQLAEKEGVFTQLVNVSPNRDSVILKIWRRTSGEANWKLATLSVQPSQDANFACDNDWQNASLSNQRPLLQQAVVIGCHKNPEKHLLLAIQTTAGPGGSFDLDSVHEEIRKLQEDMDSRVAQLQSQISAVSSGLDKEIRERAAAVLALSTSLTGVVVFVHEDASCPQGYTDLSSALVPRWHIAFDQYSFITPKDKAGSGNWPGNTDWRLDHIRLCTRQ
jgi:hypothetical protein